MLWARRIGQDAWQFPQGGIKVDESPEEALYRELYEEVGLAPDHVQIMGATQGWLHYRLPTHLVRHYQKPVCIGQKQVWYLLRLTGDDSHIRLDLGEKPEFDFWRWVDWWEPVHQVVAFKRTVYERALEQLAPLMLGERAAPTMVTRGMADRGARDDDLLREETA